MRTVEFRRQLIQGFVNTLCLQALETYLQGQKRLSEKESIMPEEQKNEKYEKAVEAIKALFDDTSVPKRKTLELLENLQEEIDQLCEPLHEELADEDDDDEDEEDDDDWADEDLDYEEDEEEELDEDEDSVEESTYTYEEDEEG